MVEANPSPAKAAKKSGKSKSNSGLRVSTAECVVEKPLLREVIEANSYAEIENRNHKADVTFLHPMAEAASRSFLYELLIFANHDASIFRQYTGSDK